MECYRKLLDEFKTLTLDALNSPDLDTFINILIKRDALIGCIIKEHVELEAEDFVSLRELEDRVLKRLEEEKRMLMEDISHMSEKKKAIKRYAPKFPFPPMPVFFDKEG